MQQDVTPTTASLPTPGHRGRWAAIAGLAVVLTACTVLVAHTASQRQHDVPPMIGTPTSQIHITPAPGDPQIPGIDPNALGQFGVVLEDPAGQGAPSITPEAARKVALPLGEGPQSEGWTIVSGPTLVWVDYHNVDPPTHCLCWVVELQAPQAFPCPKPINFGSGGPTMVPSTLPPGVTPAPFNVCDENDRHLLEFIDANSGGRWLSLEGHGLG